MRTMPRRARKAVFVLPLLVVASAAASEVEEAASLDDDANGESADGASDEHEATRELAA